MRQRISIGFSGMLAGICALTLLLATGCASSGTSAMNQPLGVKLSQYKSARVEVKTAMSSQPDKLDEFLEQLQSRIIAKLRASRSFEKIYSQAETDSTADLRIGVIITKIRDVDVFDRTMWGALAGQARTEATIEFTDLKTGKIIGTGRIEGKSSNGSVMSGTTPEAVDRVADEVVLLVGENL